MMKDLKSITVTAHLDSLATVFWSANRFHLRATFETIADFLLLARQITGKVENLELQSF